MIRLRDWKRLHACGKTACEINPASRSCSNLFPAPVGHEIAPHVCKLMLLGPIGQHRPDLAMSPDSALKHDMTPVRRPAGKIVAPRIVRKLQPALAGNIHYVD